MLATYSVLSQSWFLRISATFLHSTPRLPLLGQLSSLLSGFTNRFYFLIYPVYISQSLFLRISATFPYLTSRLPLFIECLPPLSLTLPSSAAARTWTKLSLPLPRPPRPVFHSVILITQIGSSLLPLRPVSPNSRPHSTTGAAFQPLAECSHRQAVGPALQPRGIP